MNKIVIAICFIFLIFAAGCISGNSKEETGTYDEASLLKADSCVELCIQKLNEGRNLSSGSCLSNEIEPDLVCDIAHNPREAVDDLPENQCSAYREGKAHHFVEVDENCSLIRAA